MITIIICNKQIIDDCKSKFISFLKPLNNEEYRFVEWNRTGENLQEAVPDLQDIIRYNKDWRAIVINNFDSNIEGLDFESFLVRNPFDVSKHKGYYPKDIDKTDIEKFRNEKEECFKIAVKHPLVKLANWLVGPRIVDFDDPIKSEEDIKKEEDEINKTIKDKRIKKKALFDLEISRSIITRDNILKENFYPDIKETGNSFAEYAPKQLVIISERASQGEEFPDNYNENHIETEYSNFAEENLYPSKTRFVLFETRYSKNKTLEPEYYFAFLTFINLFASNEYPNDALRPEKVYKAGIEIIRDKMNDRCDKYIAKLKATQYRIRMEIDRKLKKKPLVLDNRTAETIFESRKDIKAKINSYYDPDALYSDRDIVEFVTDLPESEEENWKEQFEEIKKSFGKYMREPQRAIKEATLKNLRDTNTVDDERAMALNEFQRENVEFELLADEEKMVDIDTQAIIDTDEYRKKMNESAKEISTRISQRMTLKKTLISIGITLLLFLIGSIPFVVSAFKDDKEKELAIVIALLSLVLMLVACVIVVLVFRHELKEKFDDFNDTISDILDDVENSLEIASRYLTHVCNVMRFFSVVNLSKKKKPNTIKNMRKHVNDINKTIENASELFASYISDIDKVKITSDTETFDYDFEKETKYSYDMPQYSGKANIEYLQRGNYIDVPVDFVKKVSLEREELYD